MNRLDVTVPFDAALSKNRLRGVGAQTARHLPRGRTTVYKKKDARSAQDAVVLALRAASRGSWHDAPVTLWLDVTFPKAGMDAINLLESVADAAKVAIGVDDRWFHARVRWSIDRDNPHVRIRLIQAATESVRYCPGCNATKPLASGFYRNGSKPDQPGVCKECKKSIERDRHARRRSAANAAVAESRST